MAGDFNSIISQVDKSGRNPVVNMDRDGLEEFMDVNGLIDLGFQGGRFTWWRNCRRGPVWERLDRAVANTEW